MKRIVYRLLIFVACWIAGCSIMVLSLYLAHLIPSESIEDNVLSSSQYIQQEGLYHQLGGIKWFQLDTFTDALMLNIAISSDHDEPLQSALLSMKYHLDDGSNIAKEVEHIAREGIEHMRAESYARYWHGYLIFLRPIMLFFDYQSIRWINCIVFTCMLLVCIYIMRKRIGKWCTWGFIATMGLTNYITIPYTLQFSSCFYIALSTMILIMTNPSIIRNSLYGSLLFFITGMVTSFFDLLTTPIITLGFPLIIYGASISSTKRMHRILSCSLIWGIGYGSAWGAKWLIAWLTTDINVISDATRAIATRTSNIVHGNTFSIEYIVSSLWDKLISIGPLSVLLVVALVFLIIVYLKHNKGLLCIISNSYLLFIACIAPFWFLALRNHSIEHIWFTYRSLYVTLWALLVFICNTTNFDNRNKIAGHEKNRCINTML